MAHTVDTDSVIEFASEIQGGGSREDSKNVFAMREFERDAEEEEIGIRVRSETKVEFSNV